MVARARQGFRASYRLQSANPFGHRLADLVRRIFLKEMTARDTDFAGVGPGAAVIAPRSEQNGTGIPAGVNGKFRSRV